MSAEKYGGYYWGIRVAKTLSKTGDIYAYADEVVVENGALILKQNKSDGKLSTLVIAAGQWSAVYAASLHDGHAVSVEHWRDVNGEAEQ